MLLKPDIFIVDDHAAFRQVLKSIFSALNIATVIGEASNGKEFIKLLSLLKPDLVIMDIDMPVMNGKAAIHKALKMRPELKIIACTMFSDEEFYYKMIATGVKGIILKSSDICEFEIAMEKVMMGQSYFPLVKPGIIRRTSGSESAEKPSFKKNIQESKA